MKIVWFVLSVVLFDQHCSLVSSANVQGFNVKGTLEDLHWNLDSKIYEEQVVDMIHNLIQSGSEYFGIPPLDPLNIEGNLHVGPLKFLNYLGLDYANLDGVHSTKLNQFIVNSFNINALQLRADFNFTFPEINADANHYNISGDLISAIPFDGDGDFTATVRGVVISGSLVLGVREETQYIYLKTMSLDLVLGEVQAHISGIMGGSRLTEMVSEALTEAGPIMVERLKGIVGPDLVETLRTLINGVMDSMELTVSDILQCMQTGDCFNKLS